MMIRPGQYKVWPCQDACREVFCCSLMEVLLDWPTVLNLCHCFCVLILLPCCSWGRCDEISVGALLMSWESVDRRLVFLNGRSCLEDGSKKHSYLRAT